MKVAEAAGIQLHIVYMGKSNLKEQISKNISTIKKEKLSHLLQDVFQVWFFWKRLESMSHSKMHLQYTMENDPIMQEIKNILQYGERMKNGLCFSRDQPWLSLRKIDTMLSYDKSNRGWAVFWNESAMATYFKHGVMSDEELFMSRMPRYSVYDPSLIDPAVIMYIQEVWQFKEPILMGGKTLVTRDLAN
ncbi:hypothetical protein Pint_28834 [Pistacia integerrima]|uniref:Uncharacterized protein n=1 Tax=Pistacia integerrima TaxID=434235 RepID=A0ACC0X385_9ROSI|nr:hypothetical protein Pint_28834 [Pistacia integerrima]